ncbi:uncharacterized protein LOC129599087 [Paramacrobiotus metropolitanus]|uniref:uncharacterized protein LOC129599087 n=1 Tax=Paramacrobiotus metropolitanus TaxID=2943436 RepID=UPI002445BFC6|nr:uncharacterized protein LOC129599087 [Paramacrobiotus metropolitanus]
MLVYYNDNKSQSMYAWNAVEVLVDGLLQLGRVINVVKKGLLIDFGCASHRKKFFKWEHVFHATRVFDPLDTLLDPNVQVLLRAGADCPWKWYPGIALSPGDERSYLANLYIVEAQLPHGTVRELLPRNQVRRPPSDADLVSRRVQENDFVLRSCPMPSAWPGAADLLREIFPLILPRARRVLYRMVQNDSLLYVQLGSDCALLPNELEELFHRTKEKLAGVGFPNDVWVRTSLGRQLIDGSLPVAGQRQPHPVPSHLPLWNALLTTEADFPDVRVSGRKEDCPLPTMQPLFWMLTCLLHCVNSNTKTVVLMHAKMDECEDAAAMIRFVVGRTGTLVFYRKPWGDCCGSADVRSERYG